MPIGHKTQIENPLAGGAVTWSSKKQSTIALSTSDVRRCTSRMQSPTREAEKQHPAPEMDARPQRAQC
jgi:hypothetical protein